MFLHPSSRAQIETLSHPLMSSCSYAPFYCTMEQLDTPLDNCQSKVIFIQQIQPLLGKKYKIKISCSILFLEKPKIASTSVVWRHPANVKDTSKNFWSTPGFLAFLSIPFHVPTKLIRFPDYSTPFNLFFNPSHWHVFLPVPTNAIIT